MILSVMVVSGVVFAHYPHDVAWWAAISPDASVPRLATSLERIDMDILGRSDDGLDWAARLVGATNDGVTQSGVFLTPERLALAVSARGLLVSEDAGDSFTVHPSISDRRLTRLSASPSVEADGVAFAAGETAVWRTTDAGRTWGPVAPAQEAGFSDVDVSPEFPSDGRVCASESETIVCSDDGGANWIRTALPAGTFRISVGASGRVWAAVPGSGLFLSSDHGASFALSAFAGEEVSAIAELSGELVLSATANHAERRSTDGGLSWTHVPVQHIEIEQGREGVNFFEFLEGPDGAVYMTCWNGLARSEDRGLSYSFYNTERPQNTHSVRLTRGAEGETLAWIGTYGGGPVLTDVATFASRDFPTLPVKFTRNTPVTAYWGRDGVAVFDEGYSTWATVDGGATWTKIASDPLVDGDVSLAQDVKGVALTPDAEADGFLLAIVGQDDMSFWASEDLGESWTVGVQDPPCEADGFAVALARRWPEDARAWASCGGRIYVSHDRAAYWSVAADLGVSFVFGIEETPSGVLLVATSDGLWRVEEAGPMQIALDGEVVTSVASADRVAFAVVPAAGWMRSEDDGNTWELLDVPSRDLARMVSLSPGFDDDGTLAVAGYGGAWASTDRGESWFSIYALDVFEAFLDTWEVEGTWKNELDPAASGGEVVWSSQVGAARTLRFRGISLAVEVPEGADVGEVAVTLDGADPQVVAVEGPTSWRADALADEWHSLRLEVASGTVTLDAVRVTRIAEVGRSVEQGGSEREAAQCGCSTRAPGSLCALALLSAVLQARVRSAASA